MSHAKQSVQSTQSVPLVRGKTVLRAWQESDITTLQQLRNNVPLQLQLMTHPTPNSPEQVRDWLIRRSQASDAVFFVIVVPEKAQRKPQEKPDQVIGYIQLVAISAANRWGRLGICIAPEAQGQGHGTAAIQLLEAYSAHHLNVRKIMLEVLAENQSACQLYQRLGYQCCGRLREHHAIHEKFQDVILMEKLLIAQTLPESVS